MSLHEGVAASEGNEKPACVGEYDMSHVSYTYIYMI